MKKCVVHDLKSAQSDDDDDPQDNSIEMLARIGGC